VSVYRLVSQNTIEEKIVERAQQKLKLDAMVVQQGRLKDQDNKVSKDELMAAVRFGADAVFRSEESTITDEDIDVILEKGAAKTKELMSKIQKAEKGDLLDFRLDGGISSQEFEGVDYSDKVRLFVVRCAFLLCCVSSSQHPTLKIRSNQPTGSARSFANVGS
jgi:SWI/SNF-related matrix-associated actin-dependent regulator of chromatin subfamily A member 5